MVKPLALLEQVRDCIRTRHLAYRTEKTYLYWIRRFIWFHELKDPRWAPMRSVRFLPLWPTMIYTHVLNRGGRGVKSPLDRAGGLAD